MEQGKYKESYFYTTDYPYRWSSGRDLHTLHPDTYEPIASLEEAEALADRFRIPGMHETSCVTTFGVEYSILL